jgi:hypothetical protein
MWILWHLLYLTLSPALGFEFPERMRCATKTDCVAIRGLCQEWEFAHKRFAVKKERKNSNLDLITPCVETSEVMLDSPEADCFQGICVSAKSLQPKTGCAEFAERLGQLFLLGSACSEHSECERGLGHCGQECEFKTYNKEAKSILSSWQAHYADNCAAPCTNTCIDPLGYLVGRYAPRCVQGRCVFTELKQIRVRR